MDPFVLLHYRIADLLEKQGDAQAQEHWRAAHGGQARIVLGTRLAVFAPLPELGLIVVDEDQDASFKQAEGFRYSARDIAVARVYALLHFPTDVIFGAAIGSAVAYAVFRLVPPVE